MKKLFISGFLVILALLSTAVAWLCGHLFTPLSAWLFVTIGVVTFAALNGAMYIWANATTSNSSLGKVSIVATPEGLGRATKETHCLLCGRAMKPARIGVECDNGHPSLLYTVIGNQFYTGSKEVAEALIARGYVPEKSDSKTTPMWTLKADQKTTIRCT